MEGSWECSACTFLNTAKFTSCEICGGQQRPPKIVKMRYQEVNEGARREADKSTAARAASDRLEENIRALQGRRSSQISSNSGTTNGVNVRQRRNSSENSENASNGDSTGAVIGEWICGSCTYHNRPGRTLCEICDASNSNLPPQPKKPSWFSDLFGFDETNYSTAKKWLAIEPDDQKREGYYNLRSLANGRCFAVGKFSTPSISELRNQIRDIPVTQNRRGLQLTLIRADVSELQADPSNSLSTFQAASQFNCLEAVAPSVTPEDGITGYSSDKTQGPACSISAGAATAFRNYFVPVANPGGSIQLGQTAECQINTLTDLNALLGNTPKPASEVEMKNFLGVPLPMTHKYFTVHGGYTLALNEGLEQLNAHLESANREKLLASVRVGHHQDVQVTSCDWGRRPLYNARGGARQENPVGPFSTINQVFTAAPAVTYSGNRPRVLWKQFAGLLLEATYEAVLLVAICNSHRNGGVQGSNRVFLTLVGGGVFGNEIDWIIRALEVVLDKYKNFNLDVRVVSFNPPEDELTYLIRSFAAKQAFSS